MSDSHHEVLTRKTDEGLLELTEAGEFALEGWVTDVKGDVYAVRPEADMQAVAAALARLSRNPNDARTIIASEFLGDGARDTELLRRVVNQFGDDSVMQLYPMQMVLEGISNLATKEVEWGRLAAYLEQSTRYLRFDRKNEQGEYAYYTPEEFDDETTEVYQEHMDGIFDTYSHLYEQLKAHIMETSEVPEEERDAAWRNACHAQACDGVRSLLPAATKATVGVQGSAQAIYNMILHLRSHELPEMRMLGTKALAQARMVAPVFFERADMPTRGQLVSNHREETREATTTLAEQLLSHLETEKPTMAHVKLLGVDGSEDELVAKILADASTHPFETIQQAVADFTEEQRQLVINTYVGDRYNRRAKPGRAFELPHYLFEVVCDYGAFRDIQRHRMVDGLEWQPLRTSLGHVTPDIIHEAGLADEYSQVFAHSAELHDVLKDRGYDKQAQYATLFGHLMRFNLKVNARSLLHTAELRTSPQGHPAYRQVYQDMYEQVAGVHPHVAEAMKFVSLAEDEDLARLGAERNYQQKYGQ